MHFQIFGIDLQKYIKKKGTIYVSCTNRYFLLFQMGRFTSPVPLTIIVIIYIIITELLFKSHRQVIYMGYNEAVNPKRRILWKYSEQKISTRYMGKVPAG